MLRIEKLHAYYDRIPVLKGVDLKVDKNEAVAVLGPNGAGKTTLLRSICGLVRTNGRIIFDGEEISYLKPYERIRRGISICPEGRGLFLNMSVEDNLLLGAISRSDNYEDRLEYVFNLFPTLRERRNQIVKTMSGGEQQMLAIARALMSNPKLLLLDEPSIGLAPVIIEKIVDTLKKIKEDSEISILIVEQNINLAFEIADRVYILARGKIVKEGHIKEIKNLEEIYMS